MKFRKALISIVESLLIKLTKDEDSYRMENDELSYIRPLDVEDRMPEDQLQEIRPGDVVWCLMPIPLKRLLSIEESHRIRPYLVTEIDQDGLWGYYCSSSPSKRIPANEQFVLHKEQFFSKRDTYVNLHTISFIPYHNVKSFFYAIDHKTFSLLQEHQRHIHTDNECLNEQDFEAGTIVRYKEDLYLIYHSDHGYVYGVKLLEYQSLQCVRDQDILFVLFDTIYKTDFAKLKSFPRTADIEWYTCCSKEKVDEINRLRAIVKQKKAKACKPARNNGNPEFVYAAGTMLSYSDFHIYVYLFTLGKSSYGVDMKDIRSKYIPLRKLPKRACKNLGLCERWAYEQILQGVVYQKYGDIIDYLVEEYKDMDRKGENIFI